MLGQHTDENRGAANVLGVFTLCRAAHTGRRQKSVKNNHLLAAQPAITPLFTLSSVVFSFYFIFCFFLYFVVECTVCVCWGSSKKEQ